MELNEGFWQKIKDNLKSRYQDNKTLETWLNPISFVEVTGPTDFPILILGVPNELSKYFVVENLFDKIFKEVFEIYGKTIEVDVIVKKNQVVGVEKGNNELNGLLSAERNNSSLLGQQSPVIKTADHGILNKDSLNPEYTFHTFVVGRNTEFAHAASFNVARNPGAEGYNPLFICGPVGMGKTHLLHAVGNHIKSHLPQLRIQYIRE